MRIGLLSLLLMAVVSHPLRAQQPEDDAQLRREQVLWRYANCVADRFKKQLPKFLSVSEWDVKTNRSLENFSQRTAACLPAGYRIQEDDDNLIRGWFAGALFAENMSEGMVSVYDGVPQVFGDSTTGASSQEQRRASSRLVGECLFRSDPQMVAAFLKGEPGSESETNALAKITSIVGQCQSGRLDLTKRSLRGVLGEAAYAVEEARLAMLTKTAEAKN